MSDKYVAERLGDLREESRKAMHAFFAKNRNQLLSSAFHPAFCSRTLECVTTGEEIVMNGPNEVMIVKDLLEVEFGPMGE